MGAVPRTLQKKLPRLLGLLKDNRYVQDPQLMFGAIGDATCDRAPLQVGQFESDNRMERHLENILPEGASYAGDEQVLGTWRALLGQNVIELADLDAVCETIALAVGLGEEAIDLAAGLADLQDVGSTAGRTVGRALAGIGGYHAGGKGRNDRALGSARTPRALPSPRSGKDNHDLPPGSVLL
jgi:hypothetical protein